MWIPHIAAGLVGVYLVYLTFAMEESTEGVWVNRIEALWIALDDRKKTIDETTKLVFSKVANHVSQTLNKVFGPKLFSPQLIGISSSLSFTSFFFIVFLIIAALFFRIATHSELLENEFAKHVLAF